MADLVDFEACERALGVAFKNRAILQNALTHSSAKSEALPSNERMEFFGDAVLGMEISRYLYEHYPELNEGDLTKIKSVVVSRATLAEVCQSMGVQDFILVGKGVNRSEFPVSLWANIFESLVAAVYFDQGMRKARTFILKYLGKRVDKVALDKEGGNYKSQLQHYAQKRFNATPAYVTVEESGPDHMKSFKVQVVIGGQRYECGGGSSKKEAEQEAARNTLHALIVAESARPGLDDVEE